MKGKTTARTGRIRRHQRVRRRVSGTPERPRLAVFRSLNHIYAQVIDDTAGRTLCAASDTEKGITRGKSKTETAGVVGEILAKRAKESGIQAVVFDRGGFKYHGRVKALAEAVRKGGISF